MVQALGGQSAIDSIKSFTYTLTQSTLTGPSSSKNYHLNLQHQYISVSSNSGAELVSIGPDGAWKTVNGKRQALLPEEQATLRRPFFFNFIPMLQNKQLLFSYLRSDMYGNRRVDIVRVSDPDNNALILDLFIDRENGQVVTSSKPNPDGTYPYFADELEYEPIGEGIIFPLVYRVLVDGKVTSQGRFENIRLEK